MVVVVGVVGVCVYVCVCVCTCVCARVCGCHLGQRERQPCHPTRLLLSLSSCSVVSDSLQPHGLQHTRLPSLSFPIFQSLLKLMSTELVMPSNHLILCHPPLLPPSIFPRIRVFSSESVLHIRWPKY